MPARRIAGWTRTGLRSARLSKSGKRNCASYRSPASRPRSWARRTGSEVVAMKVIGFLNSGAESAFRSFADAFRQGLKEGGFAEGPDLKIEARWANGDY